MSDIIFRQATSADLDSMRSLLLEHGENDWNYTPLDLVDQELSDVVNAVASAVIAECEDEVVGFAVNYAGFVKFPEHTPTNIPLSETGYIGNVVVHGGHSGKGIGTRLLGESCAELFSAGVKSIYIRCHAENIGSRGMMRKAGFTELGTFFDPKNRSVGSRMTFIGQRSVSQDA